MILSFYIIIGEMDCIYVVLIKMVEIEVEGNVFMEVVFDGNDFLVVWNLWLGVVFILDMDLFGYKYMLCVEILLI